VIILRRMRWAGHVAHIGDELNISWIGNQKGNDNFEEDERIILKRLLQE
jgi:hypothetical protein